MKMQPGWWIQTGGRQVRPLVLGGLAQCAVLLAAALTAAMGAMGQGLFGRDGTGYAIALLWLSLLPVGVAIRSRRLTSIALFLGALFLAVAFWIPIGWGFWGMVLLDVAAVAAAAGQASNLEALPLGGTVRGIRLISHSSIVICLALLLLSTLLSTFSLLGIFWGHSLLLMVLNALLLAVLIDLILTVLTLISAAFEPGAG